MRTETLAPMSRSIPPKVRAAVTVSFKRTARLGKVVLATGFLALGACSDAVTAPEPPIDRVAAARVMPSVTDARVRAATGIENEVIRQRAVHDLFELETALGNGDGQKARFHLRVVGSLLTEYRAQQGSATKDGADVGAIELALYAVSNAVNGRYELRSSL